jgi:hypothetical protein
MITAQCYSSRYAQANAIILTVSHPLHEDSDPRHTPARHDSVDLRLGHLAEERLNQQRRLGLAYENVARGGESLGRRRAKERLLLLSKKPAFRPRANSWL